MRHDPVHVAYLLRWSCEHWKQDNTQPRDLDDLLERAAQTLDYSVPSFWRVIATVEAIVLLFVGIWLSHT